MPKEWNIAHEGREGYLRMDYGKMSCCLWGAVQEMQKEIIQLKKEITKLKGKGN